LNLSARAACSSLPRGRRVACATVDGSRFEAEDLRSPHSPGAAPFFATIVRDAAPAAAKLVQGYDGTIDPLLTDIVMPGVNGADLAASRRSARPGLGVVSTSGRSGNMVVDAAIPKVGEPFEPKHLTQTERGALEKRAGQNLLGSST
jgi:hypothetical protein